MDIHRDHVDSYSRPRWASNRSWRLSTIEIQHDIDHAYSHLLDDEDLDAVADSDALEIALLSYSL
jgi:hydrogenase maturation factor HypF (carbamoyltransferase family)